MEDIINRGEIDKFWRVFVVDGGDAFDDLTGHILKARVIVPKRFELIDLLLIERRRQAQEAIGQIIAAIATEADGGKLAEW